MTSDGGLSVPSAVRLLPVGGLDPGTGRQLAAGLSSEVGLPCRLSDESQELALPRLAHRDQLHADALLEELESHVDDHGEVLVGITPLDIGNPVFAFFFGLARHGGRAAIVSLRRLDPTFYGLPPDPRTILRRARVELRHELGHVGGLGHCDDNGCLMHFAPTVEALDVRGHSFCTRCAERLPEGLRGPRRQPRA